MSQKAAVYVKKHEYPVLQEREIPKPKGQDVLLKITSIGLNPIDYKIIEYGLFGEPPKILGIDVAGVIEEIGPDVKSYKKGDRIVSSAGGADFDHGGYQQYALVGTSPNLTAKLPDNITDDEAATLPTAINTAQVALYDKDGHGFPNPFEDSSFGKGKSFLVAGGSSAIGLAALQFLKLSGFETIITTASKQHEHLVKQYGATHFIDRSLPLSSQVEKIKSIAPKLQYSFDGIGIKDTNLLSAQSFGPQGGHIVSSLPVSKEVLAEYKNVTGRDIYSGPAAHPESAAKIWTKMTEALRKGDVKPLPYKVHEGGLGKITEALGAVKKVSGYKVVVHPQE